MQTKLRTYEISPNNNICFPVGTILTVQKQHAKLGFQHVFSKYKTKGRDLNSLITALVSYKLTDNFSISKVRKGNVPDTTHFTDTYLQINSKLEEGSRITFDKGGHSKDNIKLILADKMKYLTAKKLNKSDDKRIEKFDKSKAELIDAEKGVYGIKFVKPSSIDYFYFSETL